ncbi:MAG: ABC transporter permease [Chloroflexota bacterium]
MMPKQARALAGAASLLLLWLGLTAIVGPRLLPWPWTVLAKFAASLWPTLVVHTLASLLRALAAIAVSVGIGAPLGIWMGTTEWFDRALAPLTYVLYPIPKVALLPLVLVVLGLGEGSKLVLLCLILFFQVLVASRDAVRGIERQYVFSLQSLAPTPWQRFRYLYLPYALPGIIGAVRVGVGTALAVLFFAENYGTRYGLGYYIMDRWMRFMYPDMFAGIVALSLLGLAMFRALDWLERALCPWRHLSSRDSVPGDSGANHAQPA